MTGDDASFDARAFGASYDFLGRLPPSLYESVLFHDHGDLRARVEALLVWRDALLDGRLPDPNAISWPSRKVAMAIVAALERLGIARFCRANEEVTDALLAQVLALVEDLIAQTDARLKDLLASLRVLAKDSGRRRAAAEAEAARAEMASILGEQTARSPDLAPAVAARIAEAAQQATNERDAKINSSLKGMWESRIRAWAQIEEVFGELGQVVGIGWDLARRALRMTGWLEAARLAKTLETLPALRELIRTLGRLHDSDAPDLEPVLERIFKNVVRAREDLVDVRTPLAPHETRGVTRSAELSRMLPCEAVQLGHPVLKYLWHARRADQALLTYRVEGLMPERLSGEREGVDETRKPRPRLERGPIILCIDTSGSMSGAPENIAKAIALEAARTAHRERRRCLLYTFGGPGQIVEHDLSLDERSLPRLLTFLGSSFGGGTDIAAPLEHAARRLGEDGWSRADVVLVTDGEFPTQTTAYATMAAAKEARGARVHGILIGNRQSASLQEICDWVHSFTSWGAMLGDD
jgi:uncharacterized protein with von Willebrand factor type A (vWA) domain